MQFDILSFIIGAFLTSIGIFIYHNKKTNALTKELNEKEIAITRLSTILEKENETDKIFNTLPDIFKSISSDVLRQNNRDFLALADQQLKQLNANGKKELEDRHNLIQKDFIPIKETLGKIEKELFNITENEKELKQQTSNLVNALKESHMRGRWGEIQLKRVAELAGMLNHCDFYEQTTFQNDDNNNIRPDMIIRLPNNRKIAVDAKTPLDAYLRYIEAPNEKEASEHLIKHGEQLKTHIKKLAEKRYWDHVGDTLDFVVLFIPGENFFSAGLKADPSLIEFGVDKKVIIATPTTLIALLKAISYGWQQNALAENALKIAELGKMLYERLATFAEYINEVGKGINKSVDSYNKMVGSLESRLLPSARQLKELHINTAKELEHLAQVDHLTTTLSAPELTITNKDNV